MNDGADTFLKNRPPTPFDWSREPATARRKAFFDITVDNAPLGRLVFQLAYDVVPNTVQNFCNLCEGKGKFSYKNTKFHYVSKGIALMGGDVENAGGKLSHSSYTTRYIPDENYIIPHAERGLIR